MIKYFLLGILILSLSACSPELLAEEEVIPELSLQEATIDYPLVVQEDVFLPVAGSTTFDIRFFNAMDETTIGFGSDLRDKSTILCFGLEGENVNMVLRAPPASFGPSEEKELEILLEDKSRSTRGKKYTCTLQVYNSYGDSFQKDFDVVLV